MSVPLPVLRLPHHDPALPLPAYETVDAAGADLRACLPEPSRAAGLTLASLDRAAIPTGLAVAVPAGFELQVRPRSGRALREGLSMPNSPGTVDADYRGELMVLVVNLGREPLVIRHGERIAQAVLCPVARAAWTQAEALDETARGAGGFGSTGR
ncbi:dUTP diphosphatase [Rubrimonas cliftonensis]|uniref:Deoxyuridine 5'-triphosphate nucleotidohydrolase n=1 Tax=Rubrimonas cliftonensis TaxID=89524 RepID=A0A1H3X1Y8_9RHOB|nr:dUTP diphosphatase [Rubrimonas cliftonensis]SDZ93263.1 deoxyuridine 5'-triphosphate nucleotidohydrolase [Rubrimonas cliftonensis]